MLAVVVVVVVVVVVAIVLAAVCSVRRRRKKYDPTCNVSYEVPPDVYVGEFTKHWHTVYYRSHRGCRVHRAHAHSETEEVNSRDTLST